MIEELIEKMVVLVQSGMPIREASIKAFGYQSLYYRVVSKSEQSRMLMIRAEFVASQQSKSAARMITIEVYMPASRRDRLKKACIKNNESVNAYLNRLIVKTLEKEEING